MNEFFKILVNFFKKIKTFYFLNTSHTIVIIGLATFATFGISSSVKIKQAPHPFYLSVATVLFPLELNHA